MSDSSAASLATSASIAQPRPRRRPLLLAGAAVLVLIVLAIAWQLAVRQLQSQVLAALGPRASVASIGLSWGVVELSHYASLPRAEIRAVFAAWCAVRPAGGKFAHRATDGPAGSSPSMKWVNPPVAYMLHAGVPRLVDAGVTLAPVHAGDPQRVALEAYPGLLARELIGARSYKSDERAKQTPERLIARKDLVEALEQGRTRLGLRLKLRHAQREALAADASGDTLDAVLCLAQAAWAHTQPHHGLPLQVDPLEGWIVSAPWTP